MSFRIIRDDITRVRADAIVNTANPEPVFGNGTDRAVYEAAGAEKLLEARRRIGSIRPGRAAVTDAFALPARYIIHTAGPAWIDGKHGEYETLASCYRESLQMAEELNCGSIAFPLISTGVYGFPKADALRIALDQISSFLMKTGIEMDVILVVFNREAFEISSSIHGKIDQFIDEKTVRRKHIEEHRPESSNRSRSCSRRHQAFVSGESSREASKEFFSLDSIREDSLEDGAEYTAWEPPSFIAEAPSGRVEGFAESLPAADRIPGTPDSRSDRGSGQKRQREKPNVLRETLDLLREKLPFGKPSAEDLDEAVRNPGESFQQLLLRMIDERRMTDPQVYKKANIDRKLFSKIRCTPDYKPSKKTALALAIALELDLKDTVLLLGRAGLALSPAIRSDLIIEYCIENGIYDIIEINALLFEYEQPLLC